MLAGGSHCLETVKELFTGSGMFPGLSPLIKEISLKGLLL